MVPCMSFILWSRHKSKQTGWCGEPGLRVVRLLVIKCPPEICLLKILTLFTQTSLIGSYEYKQTSRQGGNRLGRDSATGFHWGVFSGRMFQKLAGLTHIRHQVLQLWQVGGPECWPVTVADKRTCADSGTVLEIQWSLRPGLHRVSSPPANGYHLLRLEKLCLRGMIVWSSRPFSKLQSFSLGIHVALMAHCWELIYKHINPSLGLVH